MKKYVALEADSTKRLDKLLSELHPEFSRTWWQDQIEAGRILVNNQIKKNRYAIIESDVITYDLPKIQTSPISYKLKATSSATNNLNIVFEDDNVLVINKPHGLITHPAHANTKDSLVHRVVQYNKDVKNAVYDPTNPISLMRPGIVHRLDKDTSGAIIVAKNKQAMSHLAKQIQEKKAQKTYLALLYGWLEESPITVTTFLNRDKYDRRKIAVSEPEKGREATTIFTIKERLTNDKGDKVTLVEASPITGRTHQIRVHAAHLGHPVIGDQYYGFKESENLSDRLGLHRQFLHAYQLAIRLPNHPERTTFTADLPDDLIKCLAQFRSTNA